MPLSSVSDRYYRSDLHRFEQGDILRDVNLVQWAERIDAEIVIDERVLPYCVVLSQECDLEHDYNTRTNEARANNDKYLHTILLCPAYPAAAFKDGTHLSAIGLTMQRHPSEQWKRVKTNQLSRYHFLGGDAVRQVPDLVLDFKHYFAAPREVLYREQYGKSYLATLEVLHRDQLSGRFAHYLSRVGLPEPTEDAS